MLYRPRLLYLGQVFLILAVVLNLSCRQTPGSPNADYLNIDLPLEARVNDLVSRMTLEEKIAQMGNDAPAIPHLGVPPYNWWAEGLHGVARAGLATVFPQAIGLAATWDEDMMFRVSTAISDEARAKHHAFAAKDKRFIYQGLTFWSPNINIFRDPRWGRGQETYGEDPYLTGKLAVQFIKGLQGDDPNYYKTIATVKHFAVHNGPEPERHEFNAIANDRDFKQTYLPQFEMGIKEGKAYSAMCAYNRLNGEACCGSEGLLTQLLREEWGFDGYVVSDCGAILDIYEYHKLVGTAEEAAAMAVKAGCDLNCGKVYENLGKAIEKGLITEAEIDVAVKRLFTARFKLGMFDPEGKVKYAQIPYEVVDSEPHRQLALEAAHKSMVLLKNENNVLPLNKDEINTLAVIGPNSDQWLMLLGNYNGVPNEAITPLQGIKEKLGPGKEVLFAQGSELSEGLPMYYTIPVGVLSTPEGQPGLQVEYFDNAQLEGAPLFTDTDEILDANWNDKAPRDDMDDDNFGVRWAGRLTPEKSGDYQLGVISTCKTRLYLNDSLVAQTVYHFRDEYGDPRLRKSVPIHLEAGKAYDIRVEAGETFADAQVQLVWAEPKPQLKEEALAVARQADAVVLCMGLTARMEGEEMDVQVEGFRGGDRTRIDLPEIQQDLIRSIQALGKPVVLVLLNGSALAVNWEDANIPAILEAWYPGQAAGRAIADVLFGDYNPGGRLPVTFYHSVNDLPAFTDYNMSTQTYRYFTGTPLYPFGYGLSYTTFSYDQLEVPKQLTAGEDITISVQLTNTGELAGDEVVQLYLAHQNAAVRTPIRELKSFKRIHLDAGESQTVSFELPANALAVLNEANEWEILPGEVEIAVGGGQPHTVQDGRVYQSLKASVEIL
ncbi:MAG: glycoside hydrolase family 3 C-terminal domain-containing protein [Saprospiraceae bacterium]|nr:glycoside hydrolase family 3 C-terminal domain-containing protein [Lewinella sp.]